ncbi:MAG: LysM peptidoglycan-binding domain-containing protein [Chloroflexi bacterium]|nr:LysM peptidoglycan-binding domain-containing protein [Chloroflexota bacterium]
MKKSHWIAGVLAVMLSFVVVTAVYAFKYQVRWGDTVWGLSRTYGTTVQAITDANQLADPNLIFAGQILEIPVEATHPPPIVTPPPVVTPPPEGTVLYTVRWGDTLYSIARYFNTTVYAIQQYNYIPNPNLIFPGQQLIIPVGGNPPVVTPPPVTPPPVTPPPGVTPTPSPTPPTTTPPPINNTQLGGQSFNMDNKANMERAGMTWLKIQYKWTAGDSPDALRASIEEAHNNGFKILISVAGKQVYPPANGIDFNSFVIFISRLAGLNPDAIEIWNEENIDFEWPAGQINPTTYVNSMLAPSFHAIKGANPNIIVISGALAPTGFDNGTNAWSDARYLQGMQAAGAVNYMDCIGMHYNVGATSPYATSGHPADAGDNHYTWYYQPMLDVYYNSFYGARPICVTELGYLSPEGFDGLPPAFNWAANTTVADQALWLGQAVEISISHSVPLAIVYNVDFRKYEPDGDPQAGYAIMRPDGTCPACDTLGAVMGK